MMTSAITCVISEHSDLKRQKLELEGKDEDTYSDSSADDDEYELQLFREEHERSGWFDFDFSKIPNDFGFKPVIFSENDFTDEPDTGGALLERLSREAIQKHNEEKKTNLEFVDVLRANYHPGGGITFYITFEANDASDLQPKAYQSLISYLPIDIRIRWCKPKP